MTAQVAITGIGAVSPNGIGRELFWRNCLDGVSGVGKITRFNADGFMVRIAGEVNDLDVNAWVDPKDRPHVPRAVPLARAAVAEALADAGLEPDKMTRDELRGIGVSCGSGGAAQEFSEEQYRLFYAGLIKHCSVYVIPSSTPGTMASEISMHYGFRGYSHLISNGCTSSTDAIGYAYRSIKHGVMDTMIAGGTDAPIAPLIVRGFQLMRIMTQRWNEEPHRGSRPFSKDRDGFVLSEGAWFFVLENAEKARARGARIYGYIEGYGATCEAFHRVRLEESGEEPARAMLLALAEAGLETKQIDYLQYHGTSTELNDRIESKAVQIAFGDHAEKLPGSSVKSIIGHPQGACGAAGMAAVLLSMRDGVAHPTINLEEAAPECPLDYIPLQSRKLQIEHAVANCIAFGSKNSALVLGRAS